MIFQDNMEILKESFPEVWQKVLELEKVLDNDLVHAAASKEDCATLRVGERYIHDKRHPRRETRALIEKFNNIHAHTDILFYGIGLGYHIKSFTELYPGKPFSIYEPVPEVFFQFLSHIDLKELPLHLIKNIFMEAQAEELEDLCASFVGRIRKTVLVIDLPTYGSIFPEKRQAFFACFEELLNDRRFSLATVSNFQKRWTINSLNNLLQVLNTPNILLEAKGRFKNKPAVMVASGPSLEEELENLRIIRDMGRAYIFSVGTAINTLVQNGIHPHAACTYDPTEENQIVCQEVLEKGIRSIPLIFGSTVGYETLEKYPGPKMHMLIRQDSLASYYLKPINEEPLQFINDAATIAVITLQLLYQLGFNPIILVGQNLAFRDNRLYAAGSTFHRCELNQAELDKSVPVKDVYGNETLSNQSFIRMKQQIENYLYYYRDRDIINTTKHGAHIEGTRFQILDEVMIDCLRDRVVEDNLLESPLCSYNANHLIKQNRVMSNAFAGVVSLLEKCKIYLANISELAGSGDIAKIQQSYDRFNRSVEDLRSNQFFATFITPMSRVELELLILAVPDVSLENEPAAKARLMEQEFRPYLLGCEQDIKNITPRFRDLDQSIQRFYKLKTVREKAAIIKVLVVDGDGILTDETVYYSSSGDAFKRFSLKDREGILSLRERGVITLLVNLYADPIIDMAAAKWGMEVLPAGTDKKQMITYVMERYSIDRAEIACLFSSPGRLGQKYPVGLSFSARNAHSDLRHEVDHVLESKGGQGAILEIAELITKDTITI